MNAPSVAMDFRSFEETRGTPRLHARTLRSGRPRLRFVLRRALRHHAVGLDLEALRRQHALPHPFRIVFERVGHDATIAGPDDLPLALDLEVIVERIAPPQDRPRHDEPV